MRRAAALTACVAWLVPEPGTSWSCQAAGGSSGSRHQNQQSGRATPTPTSTAAAVAGAAPSRRQRHSSRRRLSQQAPWPTSAPAPASRLTAHSSSTSCSDDNTDTNGKEKPPLLCAPLHAVAIPSTVDGSTDVNGGAGGGSPSSQEAAADAVLLASSSTGKGDGTTTTATAATTSLTGVVTKGTAAAATAASMTASLVSDEGAKSSDPWRARLTLVFVACLYGTNYTAIKFMGGLMDTSSLLTLRFGLAALVLLPALRGVGRDVLLSGAEVGVYAALGYGAQAYALTSLPASQLALVGSLAVLVAPFLDHVFGRRRAGVATVCSAVLACGGAALLQSAGGVEPGAGDQATSLSTYALALMPPLFFGVSTWRMEAQVKKHPGQALPQTAGQLAVVAVSSAAWSIRDGSFASGIPEALAHPGTDPAALAVLLWLGLVTTALVLFLETDALQSLSASEVAVIESLEPLVGAGLASSMLGEPFPSPLGASFVLGGCLCSSLFGSTKSTDDDEV
ncbi:unnamed protein product [Pylaiella littoralis]